MANGDFVDSTPCYRRARSAAFGFTLIELVVASLAVVVLLYSLCGILQYAVKRWDVQTSYGLAVGSSDAALERVESDARYATLFSTRAAGSNTLYIFTEPANTDAAGNYVPQRVAGALQYVAGQKVAFYLSDTTGNQNVANGTVLWRATAPAANFNFTTDKSWSLVNTRLGRCEGVQGFSVTTVGMPANTAQVTITMDETSGHDSRSDTIVRSLKMGSVPLPITAPSGLSASPSANSISLNWSAVAGAVSYNVYRATTSGGEGTTAYATALSGTSFTDSFVGAGTTYYYEVTAVFSSESGKSSEIAATTPAGNVAVTPTTPGVSELYGEEDLNVTSSQPVTALTATITTALTTGLTPTGTSNTFSSGYIAGSYSQSGSNELYTYSLNSGDTQSAGIYKLAATYNLSASGHPTSGDTYIVNVTAGGVSQTLTGHF